VGDLHGGAHQRGTVVTTAAGEQHALRTDDGFIIPLPFGDATQWAKNVFAAGGGSIKSAGREYDIGEPRIVEGEAAGAHLPPPVRFVAGRLGLRQFVLVRRVGD
jgi:hypothetical protein